MVNRVAKGAILTRLLLVGGILNWGMGEVDDYYLYLLVNTVKASGRLEKIFGAYSFVFLSSTPYLYMPRPLGAEQRFQGKLV